MAQRTILVTDDEKSMREFLEIMLTREGHDVVCATTAEEAVETLNTRPVDLVISDIKMPLAGGLAVLARSMEKDPEVPVIMITAYASADTAVDAMKKGAYDYITKPFKIDEIKLIIAKALERRVDKEDLRRLKDEIEKSYTLGDLLGRSETMQELFKVIRKVAASRSTVLITGESGSGKELVAKAIHYLSPRKDKPFVSINCGAMPEPLLESELFGHQKGSFTGAYADKKGLLEVADGGTFLLDEVGDAPQSVQVKMLRMLQERQIKRVGGVKDINVDVRVIAATNQNLEELIGQGKFREDFFYRLNIIPINIPPLRERREDIPLLVSRFVERYAKMNARPEMRVSNEAMRMLERYHWRGNVRELENIIERAVVLAAGDCIKPENLPEEMLASGPAMPKQGVDLEAAVAAVEKEILLKALDSAGGNRKEAARLVKLTYRSFRYKLAKHGMAEGPKDGEHED
ncbi:MAG: sigma-54-dependent Fis family transcriptional regulator [Nitrospinae bacterium]|nr:sigma-54-dependent Fis family transcriptional regulator [Nitrospinota bacterium]